MPESDPSTPDLESGVSPAAPSGQASDPGPEEETVAATAAPQDPQADAGPPQQTAGQAAGGAGQMSSGSTMQGGPGGGDLPGSDVATEGAGVPAAGAEVEGAGAHAGPVESPQPFQEPVLAEAGAAPSAESIELLDDVELDVTVELGRTEMYIEDVLRLGVGSVVELNKLAGDPVDVYVNEQLVARGEVLVLNDNFCVRINDILSPLPELEQTK